MINLTEVRSNKKVHDHGFNLEMAVNIHNQERLNGAARERLYRQNLGLWKDESEWLAQRHGILDGGSAKVLNALSGTLVMLIVGAFLVGSI